MSKDEKHLQAPVNSEQWMDEFVQQTRGLLLRSLQKKLSREEAEEVLQEAYLVLFKTLTHQKFVEPRPFLFRVASNLALSRLRHAKVVAVSAQKESYSPEFHTLDTLESACKISEENELLIKAINTLPPVCRKVFVLRKLEEKSHTEIAKIMNISKKTVENHLAKGLKLCREFMLQQRDCAQGSKETVTKGGSCQ